MRWRHQRSPAAAAFAAARPPAAQTPWASARWCAVDLELSGLDPRRDEVVSFAAVPIERGRIPLGAACAGLVRPSRPPAEQSVRIHGLRTEDLRGSPLLEEAIEPLLETIAGSALVAHVARIERAFLGRALRAHGLRLHVPIADTSVIGRLWLLERDGRAPAEPRLDELAQALGLPPHTPHDALSDALATAQVFIAAATHLDALGRETVHTLTHADRRLHAARTYPAGPG